MTTHSYLNNFTLIVLFSLLGTSQMQAQSIGIGTTTPNSSSLLELSSTNKGLLIPRVALTNTTTAAPLTAFVEGMVLYNTATAGNVTPGYYGCDGTKWVRLEVGGSNWSLNGNAGTNPATNFIGTTDDVDLVFKRNNVRAGLVNLSLNSTSFGLGALNPAGTGNSNTAFGFLALSKNQTGYNNTAIGGFALTENISGWGNIAIGSESLYYNISGYGNVAVGNASQLDNKIGGYNTSIGTDALKKNRADNNTALGGNTLLNNITGYSNVAVGINALISNTNGSNLVAVGDSALYSNGLGATLGFQALNNTAIGSKALYANTLGSGNTATGFNTMYSNTNGLENTANGYRALYTNASGTSNTAIGYEALFTNISSDNTALGNKALHLNNSGSGNVAVGNFALRKTSGSSNTALGILAGGNNLNGFGNVFVGANAGENELGSNKLYIHNNNGDANNALIYGEFDNGKLQVNGNLGIGRLPSTFYPFEIRALGPNNEIMKLYNNANAEKWHLNLLSNGSLNFVETNVADNRLVLGVGGEIGVGKVPNYLIDSRFVVKQQGTQNGLGIEAAGSTTHWDFWVGTNLNYYYNGIYKGTFSNLDGAYVMASDRRLKKDILAYEPVLHKLNKLQAFNYHYLDNTNTDQLSSGFMAQDVQKLFPQAVSNIEMKNGETMLGINYQYFTVAAIKGLQEQQAIIESQEQRIAKLEELVKGLVEKK